jgi:hypothetical protein
VKMLALGHFYSLNEWKHPRPGAAHPWLLGHLCPIEGHRLQLMHFN